MKEKQHVPGPCPFVGNVKYVPDGPAGDDVDSCSVMITPGTIRLKPGDEIVVDHIPTVLRKIRRCSNGEFYGMVEYSDGGLLWTSLAPAPIPELTEFQEAQLEDAEKKIPRQFQVQGDCRNKVGDRISCGGRMGTIVLMATSHPLFNAGNIVMMDDGSVSVGDEAMALMDGRIAHVSTDR
jgi:hypothetical protein